MTCRSSQYLRRAPVAGTTRSANTGYCNREVDRLVEEQSRQTDPGARKRLVWEIEQKLIEDSTAGDLRNRHVQHAAKSPRQPGQAAL
jgi:hypothetical protein